MSRIHRHLLVSFLTAALALAWASSRACAADINGTLTLVPTGQPANGVWVSAVRLGDFLTASLSDADRPHGPSLVCVTNERGTFNFRGLAPGAYEIGVRADSLPPTLAPESKPVRTVLVSVRDAASVDLTVTRLASFDGVARRLGAGALTGVRVQAFHHGDDTAFAETWTDDHGAFHLGGFAQNVPVDLVATTKDGQFARQTKTPLHAGAQPVELVLAPWSPASKRRVSVTVVLPTGGDRHYELDWISNPEAAATGYRTTINLDRDGHGELDSPDGIFLVRVREAGAGHASPGRAWTASRLYRVEAGGGPVEVRVELNPETAENPEP